MGADPGIETAGPRKAATTIRAVFLDVDGTYADYGVVPEGHVRAVQAARKAGHRVFLCTGRPVSMLPRAIRGAGFDGLVASAGAYVEVAGEVLVDRRFSAALAARTVAALDAHNAVYVLEAQESLHVPPAAEERLRAIIEEHFSKAPDGREVGASAILGSLVRVPDLAKVPFSKVSVFDSAAPMRQLVEEIGEGIAVVENSIADEGRHAGELFQRGISKADGVAAAIAHLGIPREDSIAVGDGENDLEMLAFAGIGVAIEGSSPELLALADHTAAPPHREGLVAAFEELGLI
ncbi:HAD-IIB family hydrolase [Arthrobacter cupressi]